MMTVRNGKSKLSILQTVTGSQLTTRGSATLQCECKAGVCNGIISQWPKDLKFRHRTNGEFSDQTDWISVTIKWSCLNDLEIKSEVS
jgi:hypothetical protein